MKECYVSEIGGKATRWIRRHPANACGQVFGDGTVGPSLEVENACENPRRCGGLSRRCRDGCVGDDDSGRGATDTSMQNSRITLQYGEEVVCSAKNTGGRARIDDDVICFPAVGPKLLGTEPST
jgi:hypothetical protein